ncbi:MAG: hypothetical protein HC800_11035 [Phormidesmis sp. RL_2_1]|nr:hypothetical protein [Phormidesmis sp. RL_2_1]
MALVAGVPTQPYVLSETDMQQRFRGALLGLRLVPMVMQQSIRVGHFSCSNPSIKFKLFRYSLSAFIVRC